MRLPKLFTGLIGRRLRWLGEWILRTSSSEHRVLIGRTRCRIDDLKSRNHFRKVQAYLEAEGVACRVKELLGALLGLL